jgi:hypothetical protein
MRVLRSADEAEVVAAFLQAELESERYGDTVRRLLERHGLPQELITHAELTDREQAELRRKLLAEYRAWGEGRGLFDGFPDDVEWRRVSMRPDEVVAILYIDWDWWLRVSGGSRRPTDAAGRIRAGLVAGADAETHRPIAERLRSDRPPPELIAVTRRAPAPIVLVEGHVRLTAYALFPECLPDELELFVGVSDRIAEWSEY